MIAFDMFQSAGFDERSQVFQIGLVPNQCTEQAHPLSRRKSHPRCAYGSGSCKTVRLDPGLPSSPCYLYFSTVNFRELSSPNCKLLYGWDSPNAPYPSFGCASFPSSLQICLQRDVVQLPIQAVLSLASAKATSVPQVSASCPPKLLHGLLLALYQRFDRSAA